MILWLKHILKLFVIFGGSQSAPKETKIQYSKRLFDYMMKKCPTSFLFVWNNSNSTMITHTWEVALGKLCIKPNCKVLTNKIEEMTSITSPIVCVLCLMSFTLCKVVKLLNVWLSQVCSMFKRWLSEEIGVNFCTLVCN